MSAGRRMLCSTPRGITGKIALSASCDSRHSACAQRLAASQEKSPRTLTTPMRRIAVLNASRHHRKNRRHACDFSRRFVIRAQRLAASQEKSPTGSDCCLESLLAGAQRLAASQEKSLPVSLDRDRAMRRAQRLAASQEKSRDAARDASGVLARWCAQRLAASQEKSLAAARITSSCRRSAQRLAASQEKSRLNVT